MTLTTLKVQNPWTAIADGSDARLTGGRRDFTDMEKMAVPSL